MRSIILNKNFLMELIENFSSKKLTKLDGKLKLN